MFTETQYLRHPALYGILIVGWCFSAGIMLIEGATWHIYVPLTAFFVLIAAFLLMFRLTITVAADNISLRMSPFFGTRVIRFAEVKSITVKPLSPVFDYGGWGYRIVPFQNTTAYIMQGEAVVEIVLKSGGKKIAASLKDPDQFKAALAKTEYGGGE